MNAVEKIEPQPQAIAVVTPMALIERAMSSGANMDVIQKFVDLQEKWDARQAVKAFEEAIAKAKAEIQPVMRNATGHNSKRYADFSAIASAVDPVLGRHGLSYRFETQQTDKAITTTCILFGHGHRIPAATLTAPADMTGNKNAIQAIGSTLTYLQRYSLTQALGLAAATDDDGKAAGVSGKITDKQAAEIADKCREVSETFHENFCTYFGVEAIADLPAKDYQRALIAIGKKKGAAK